MKKIYALLLSVVIVGCSNDANVTLLEAEFSSMDSCLSKLKSTANQSFRVVTDELDEVSGFYGDEDLLFSCQMKTSGTKGIYFYGMIEVAQ